MLHKLKETKQFVPDLIIVDYLNIMSPNGSAYGMKSYERVGMISKELRSVSIETKLPILSATQSNRCLFSDTIVNEKTRGNIRIADVNIGDLLLSNNGMYNKVVKKYDIEVSKTYKITTKSGKTIICTDKHEWPTINGNKTIRTGLSKGDVLFKRSLFSCVAEKIGKFINKIKKWF